MKTEKALLAIAAGVAAGAAIGVLLAPGKGSDTRKKIIKKGDDLANMISDKIDQKVDELMSTITGKTKKTAPQGEPVRKNEMTV